MANKKVEKKEVKEIVIRDLTVKKAYYGATDYDEESKNRLTVYSDMFPYDEITAYDDTPDKLTPGWYKEQEGYCNLSSKYDIPVKDARGHVLTFGEWIGSNTAYGSLVKLKIRQKDGRIYPAAIVVLIEGEPSDPFADM